MGLFVQQLSIFVTGIVISFQYNWKLSLFAVAFLIIVVLAFVVVGILTRKLAFRETASYLQASDVAGEVLSTVRTVAAFEGQAKEIRRYASKLMDAENVVYKRTLITNSSKFLTFINR